jgi:hypothetical protein
MSDDGEGSERGGEHRVIDADFPGADSSAEEPRTDRAPRRSSVAVESDELRALGFNVGS